MPAPQSDLSIDALIGYPLANEVASEHIHPNVISILSIVPTAVAAAAIATDHPVIAAGAIVTRAFMDILDGATARKFNKTSELGDTLDKVMDYIFIAVITLTVGIKYNCSYAFYLLIILIIIVYHSVESIRVLVHDNTLIFVPLLVFLFREIAKQGLYKK